MSPEGVKKIVKEFIWNTFVFGRPLDDLKDGDSLLDKGILDSTGVLELMGFLEERFRFQIEDEEVIPENLGSIESVVSFVHRKTGVKAEV